MPQSAGQQHHGHGAASWKLIQGHRTTDRSESCLQGREETEGRMVPWLWWGNSHFRLLTSEGSQALWQLLTLELDPGCLIIV